MSLIGPRASVLGPRYAGWIRAIAGEPLPAALVDLDAFDANAARLIAPIRAAGKRVRIASKSVRCPQLLQRALALDGAIGLMTYTAAETLFHAEAGVRDLVLAYPTVQPSDATCIARANRHARAVAMVDDAAQLAPLADAARAEGTTIPVAIDIDTSYRVASLHLGVRRSPLRDPDAIVALAKRIQAPLSFAGVMGYEAQLAGVQDRPARAWQAPIIRAIKRASEPDVATIRGRAVRALEAAGLRCELVNGGGSGSVDWSSTDASLTEVTIGSGLLCGHLFDGYAGLALEPALAFALQVVRRPAPGLVTCLGGGWIASGQAGADRLPKPIWPAGASLLAGEGAGEVQTPVRADVPLGVPVLFRPAKSGEIAEHFAEYLLVRGDRLVERAPTYRGLGKVFLG